ncbi:RNA polymerase sigma-70 factor, ECF subfamily [Chitinophaga costaii]|uniref:RNA polymerase sigma-70 factor, ECF subfamily n=1 Tax=Chitinophaga costaii TaxID=1335309 RepID=A0A1C4DFL8_9BACT|nr:RNA polymerase sigma-70 factor [Chitinophaga costaii]PUZ24612.1 RNA polymerase sigma-70 factor [Chitinophaga costaii]SCC30162.1 RNA polymerase sigma-70 factor, ECF subfamily [Chitinophaga costaii]
MLNLDLLDDSQILEAVAGHNEAAFSLLYKRYQQKVYATAYFLLRDETEAHDLMQDVFWTIWEKRRDIDPDRPFQPYILTITRNKSTNRLKRAKLLQRTKHNYKYVKDSTETQRPGIELSELAAQIRSAIADIPAPAARRAFELSYLENKSQKEIADEMNISLGTVKNQVSRALKVVREKLSNINK